MNGHEKYEDLVDGYALGVLDEFDRHRFTLHLASGCEKCAAALQEARQVTDDLAYAVRPVAPRKEVRDRLFERIQLDSEPPHRPDKSEAQRTKIWMPIALAASWVIAIGLGIQVHLLSQGIETEKKSRLAIEKNLVQLQESFDVFIAPRTQTVSLAGQGSAASAQAKAFIDPAKRRLFLYVYNLPPTPPGKTYQLWIIVAGTPVSAGIFGVEPDGSARFDARTLPRFEGTVTVAVTVEPAGGVPQPTGPMVLLGT